MIYFCADDYGLCDESSKRILQCVDKGILNKVSIFPNFSPVDLQELMQTGNVRISLHLNLVEGKCLSCADEINLIADKNGNFRHTFGGLFRLYLFRKKEFEQQVYKEIKAQVLFWQSQLPPDVPFCIDSHQHTHMIPSVFRSMMRVLTDENINPGYIRIPAEPVLPYLKKPSLFLTYSPVNIIKQWLLKFLWIKDKAYVNSDMAKTYFFGILFSGRMDEKRVSKILPEYVKIAEKNGRDIEVLFHPGYLEKGECDIKNISFDKFYFSENRKTEYNSVMKISAKEVHKNALH